MWAITFEVASKRLKRQGTIDKFNGWSKLCKFTFIDGTKSDKHSPFEINKYKWKSKPVRHINYEMASKRLKPFGTIDKNSYTHFNKPCKFTFIDGSKSDIHSPSQIENGKWESKPERHKKYEAASKLLKSFGTIDKKSYSVFKRSCKFTFIDGTKSDQYSPYSILKNKWKSKPRPPMTFDIASKRLKKFGKIKKSSFDGWCKPCKFTFLDGTTTEHSPKTILDSKWKTKPRVEVGYKTASKRLKPYGTIDESSYTYFKKPCKFTFIDGTNSDKHSPKIILDSKWKTKPRPPIITFEVASKRLKKFGTLDESSYTGWLDICKFTFIDGTKSDTRSPHHISRRNSKSSPKPPITFEVASKRLKPFGTIDESSYTHFSKKCKFTFIDGTKSNKHSPQSIELRSWKTKPITKEKVTFEVASKRLKKLGRLVKKSYTRWDRKCKFYFKDGTSSDSHTPKAIDCYSHKTKPEPNGFDVNKSGYLYLFAYKVYGKTISYKIGITNSSVRERFSGVNRHLKDKSKGSLTHCAALFYFPDGHKCLEAETTIKSKFERIVIGNIVEGRSEMFTTESAKQAYLFVKMLKCCKEINSKSKRHEVQSLVKHIAEYCK